MRRFLTGWRAAVAATLTAALLAAGLAPASAVGPAVLTLEMTPVHASTGATISTAGFGQNGNRVAYRVAYSCSVAVCTDATVTLPATQLDPTYNQFRLLSYQTWTPPAGGGASISGNAASGLTVSLGDVPAGTSSTFLVVYDYPVASGYTTAAASAYFPPGFQIQQSATIASPNATTDVTAAAAPVTWQIPIPEPSITKAGPTSVRPDTNATYTIRMGSGCFVYGGSGRIVGDGSQLCAESFTVVDELPEQAVFVSASDGGTYDAQTHTVTWTGSGPNAAGGWGSSAASGWVGRGDYHPRTVVVQYPASQFPEADGGADFIVPVTNDARVSMTYLDDAATTKSAAASLTHEVARITPFGRATQSKDTTNDYTSGGQRYVSVPPDVAGMSCPDAGVDDWARPCTPGEPLAAFTSDRRHYWYVDTYNRGNVPGVATIVDDDLGDSSARVYRVNTTATTPAATIDYTITDGETVTTGSALGSYDAPAGSWITAATVTSGAIAPSVLLPTETGGTLFRVSYSYELLPGAQTGTWLNTATGTMAYPGNPEIADIDLSSQRSVVLRERPKVQVAPEFRAEIVSATVEGGGQAVPGSRVVFAARGITAGIPADEPVSPQYVFLAPEGWEIESGSAGFAAGSVPPGAAFVYREVTVDGATRQAVVASWPTGTTFGSNVAWPNLNVVASPTFAVAAGTSSTATAWVGDSLNQYGTEGVVWHGRVLDAADVDGDGDTAEAFATHSTSVAVSGSDRLDVIKEICVVTDDGCNWVSNPDIVVGVAPDAGTITYRVTLRNGGNTTLSGIVGYDVLPYVGDARGSTFGVTLSELIESDDEISLQYSSSTNPCRNEVLPDASNPGCVPGWGSAEADAASIRATVDGSLAPGASASFTFSAEVVAGANADAVACNSVAVDTASTVASEPRAVCATTQEADLAITVPERLPLQAGRPGVVPFTVENLGGSELAPASVRIDVPAGIRVTSLAPAGWSCEASATEPDGSVLGPVVLVCDAVTDTGAARSLAIDVPDALNLPAVVPDDVLVGEQSCFPAVVSGLMSDPDLGNNDASACFAVTAGDQLLALTKDDGVDSARIGDEITYALEVSNLLVGEGVEHITISDQLPDGVTFVSASDGGEVTGQGAPAADGSLPGGTVTWTLPSLSPAGAAGDGDEATGGAGASRTVTVTVRVTQAAESSASIENSATVSAADPASPDQQLTDEASDTDDLLRSPAIRLEKSVSPATVTSAGDVVTYRFVVTNTGDVTLTDAAIDESAFGGTGDALVVSCPSGATSVAPDASVTCTATYAVTQDDLDAGSVLNTARATADAPSGLDAVTSAPSTAVVGVAAEAGLSLQKSATPATASSAGEEIEYEFLVTNTGNVTVSDVQVVEASFDGDPAGLSPVDCGADAGSLAPDESVTCTATYTLDQEDVDRGTVSNTATAAGDAPGSVTDPVSDASTAVVTIAQAPALTMEKSIVDDTVDETGETVEYRFDVVNTGNVTIDGVSIEERDFTGAGAPVTVECPATSLAPDAEMTCHGTYELVQADVDSAVVVNTAAATGVAPSGAAVASPDSTATLSIAAQPGLSMVKSATPGTLVVEQVVTYSFVVTNTGNVTLTDVGIDEIEFTGAGSVPTVTCGDGAAVLAPDTQLICQATYTITQDDVDAGTLENTAAAFAVSPVGDVTSAPSSVQLPFDQTPAIELEKSADVDGYAALDDAITYGFRVTNTGNVTMSDVAIDEQAFSGTGTLSDIACAPISLLPGQFVDCAASYAVTQADIDAGELSNTAVASATAPGAVEPTTSEASDVTIPFVGAMALELVKTAHAVDANDDGIVTVGDGIRWAFTATNSGVATLRGLAIDDPMVGAVTCDATTLAPGASVECEAAYTITATDAAAGRVVNTASASALGAGGVAVDSDEATASIEVEEQPLAVTGGQLALGIAVPALLALLLGSVVLWFANSRRRVAAAADRLPN